MLKRLELEAANRGEGCLGKAADDEPVFVLRAQDVFAPITLRRWADLVEANALSGTESQKKAVEARQQAYDMEVWAAQHGSKIPD